MPIALDVIGTISNQTSTTGFTFSFSVTAGMTKPILVLYTQVHSTNGISISAASYNGVALTKVIRANDGTHNGTIEIWYLVNPASGSNTVSVTLSGGTAGFFDALCISYTGVDQTTPIDVAAVSSVVASGATSNSLSITPVTNNAWVIDAIEDGTGTLAVTGGQTSDANGTNANSDHFAVSHKLLAVAAATTVSWSLTPSTAGVSAYAATALRPSIVLGNNVSGGTSQTVTPNTIRGSLFTCANNATATGITIWANGNGGTANLRTAIYADSAGTPGAKIAESTAAVNIAASPAAWTAFSISCSLSSGIAYWLMAFADAGWVFYYATGVANQGVSNTNATYPTWPATIGASNSFSSRSMAFYVDYTISAPSTSNLGANLIMPGPSVQLYSGR